MISFQKLVGNLDKMTIANLGRQHQRSLDSYFLGSALFKYCKYLRACTKGYYLEQAYTKCTYKRHIAIEQEVIIHEAGDKAIENICKVRVYAFKSDLDQESCVFYPLSNDFITKNL